VGVVLDGCVILFEEDEEEGNVTGILGLWVAAGRGDGAGAGGSRDVLAAVEG
jgi:hypothetical protein